MCIRDSNYNYAYNIKIMDDELCSSQSCANCERLLKRACPIINFILLQLELYMRLSYDCSLSKQARSLAYECGEMLLAFLMRRGVYVTSSPH